MTQFGPAAQQEARQLIEATRDKLRSQTARPADHRPALEALLLLPYEEGGRWLDELTAGFATVYARERTNREQAALGWAAPTTWRRAGAYGTRPA